MSAIESVVDLPTINLNGMQSPVNSIAIQEKYSGRSIMSEITDVKLSIDAYLKFSPTLKLDDFISIVDSSFSFYLQIPVEAYKINSPNNYALIYFVKGLLSLLKSGIPIKSTIENGIDLQENLEELERETFNKLSQLYLVGTLDEFDMRVEASYIATIIKAYRSLENAKKVAA